MTTVYDVPAGKLIKRASEKLKEIPELVPPSWAAYSKTGSHNIRAPESPDFWYVRCASLLRSVYVKSPTGVGRLRTKYGGRKKRGGRPEHHADGGGSAIRKALQQLEKAGLMEQKKKKGRFISAKGRSFLDSIAKEVKST
ncbi:MAG: 30S ribosomal protein S19e [Candidatus Micrarchaeota archaeon]